MDHSGYHVYLCRIYPSQAHHITSSVGRKVLWSSACVCLCVCAHSWAMLATASAQVCVPLGHSSLYLSLVPNPNKKLTNYRRQKARLICANAMA